MRFEGPVFTDEPPRSSGGDFLDMGAIGERLYGEVFPGLNNAARHVRPYAAICWIVDQVRRQTFSGGESVDPKDFVRRTEQGIWKMQLLLTWAATMDGLNGFPGKTRFSDDPAEMLLTRSASGVGVSFFDAVWYQPSLVNGLRFLAGSGDAATKDTFACRPPGLALACAYEHAVSQLDPELATWLADPERLHCTREHLQALRPVLQLATPSTGECSAFLEQFLGITSVPVGPGGEKRRCGLLLVMRVLAALEREGASCSVDTIRHTMSAGMTPGGAAIVLDGIESAQSHWAALQVRAMQRLAAETLLALVDRQISHAEQDGLPRRASDIVARIAGYLATPDGSPIVTVGDLYNEMKQHQGGYKLVHCAGHIDGIDLVSFEKMKSQLRDSVKNDASRWAPAAQAAISALVLCAVESDNLAGTASAASLLHWDAGRFSLADLSGLTARHCGSSLLAFASDLIRKFVIDQHLRTAIQRSSRRHDGIDRFIFSQDREGLTRIPHSRRGTFTDVGEPADILYHALLMLENCGTLVSHCPSDVAANRLRFVARFRLNEAGHALLASQESLSFQRADTAMPPTIMPNAST